MKHNKIFKGGLLAVALGIISFSCGDEFLQQAPLGTLDPSEVVGNQNGVEALLIGAYSVVDGTVSGETGDPWQGTTSNWVFGSVSGGDAYKGSDASDQPSINEIETHTVSANNPFVNGKWKILYDGVSRSNLTIEKLNDLPDGAISLIDKAKIMAEARALRAFFHFEARKMWKFAPYLDETTDPFSVKNDTEIYPMIIADLQAAVADLQPTGMEKGRFNMWAAKALLGKVLLFSGDFSGAETALQDVYTNGMTPGGTKYALNPTFRDAFDGGNDNSMESVFASQYTSNDGSNGYNASSGEVLNFPHNGTNGAPTNCCGFFQPSHAFVNAFRTDGAGLPFLDGSYNSIANEVASDEYIDGNVSKRLKYSEPFVIDIKPVDPRLDWTVGRRDIPFLDWGPHQGQDWVRDGVNGGPFSSKKHVFNKEDVGTYTDASGWTAGYATNNYNIIRFADVILMLAEAKIEKAAPDLPGALTLINEVRARAAASNVPASAAVYNVGLYGAFASPAEARAALRMERKLELGLEGHAFFDYQRWGTTVSELNAYIDYEKKWRSYFKGASVGPEDVYYPVPQRQIDLAGGTLTQTE